MSKKHFMIDLETMGLQPNAAIVSIGATHFDKSGVIDRFYTPVGLQSCTDIGLTTDRSTESWWAAQSPEARAAWDVPNPPSIGDALSGFNKWLAKHSTISTTCPWGNGADFDLVVLKSAYEALHADPPWKFWNHHCFRTVKNLLGKSMQPRKGTHHHALDDAVHQTEALLEILSSRGIELP